MKNDFSKTIKYYRECFITDNREIAVWDIFSKKDEFLHVLCQNDFIHFESNHWISVLENRYSPIETRSGNTLKDGEKEVIESLFEIIKEPINRQSLINILTDKFNASRNTIPERIKSILHQKEIFDFNGKGFIMEAEKHGREVYYSLISQEIIKINAKSDLSNSTI